jgi:VIT1/CCC1 family predicted Fe2+/Mn2+ transporter
MKQTLLTNWEATKIGLILSAGVAFLLLVLWPASLSFTVFATNPVIVIFLFGVTGALIGKFLSKNRKGAWLGAGLMIVLLGLWLYRIASNIPLD